MSFAIAVHGSGVAACACVRLLQRREVRPSFEVEQRRHGQTLLLNAATRRLLADVFDLDASFFAGLHRIRRRVVRWGTAEAVSLVHDGFAIQESVLLDKLWQMTEANERIIDGPDFHVYSQPGGIDVQRITFGSRSAQSARVEIESVASDACWVESLSGGWLFLIPDGARSGTLLAVGDTAEHMLGESALIATQIRDLVGTTPSVAVSPSIVCPLCTADWLTCGSAAVAFDPICGEGVGNALREAILACACLTNCDRTAALAEYAPRLMLGLLKHLEMCQGFYSLNQGEWWTHELVQLKRGIIWIRHQLSSFPPPRYRTVEFDLRLMCKDLGMTT